MRPTSAVISWAIISAAAPAFAAPVSQPFDARAEVSAGEVSAATKAANPLLKEFGKNVAVNGAFAGLAAAVDHFINGGSSSAAAPTASASSKRQLIEEDVELLKRAGLGGLVGDALKSGGLSAAFTGLEDIAEDAFEGSSSSTAAAPAATPARREIVSDDELMRRAIAGLLDKLDSKREVDKRTFGTTIDTALTDVFKGGFKAAAKKGAVGGVGSGVGAGVGALLFGNGTKRGIDEELASRSPEPFSVGSAAKGAGKTGLGLAASAVGGEAISAGVDKAESLFSRDMELD